MLARSFFTALLILSAAVSFAADPPRPGYQPSVKVSAETRLDWVFAVANQSPKQPPKAWLEGYDSTGQTYELFVPKGFDARKPQAVILFISPGERPMGYSVWQQACQELGVILAGPHGAGNDCPMQRRVRIVMDVLDDLRRKFNLDPDRTYLAGFSGGGRVACGISFALPEYFGGVIPICAGGELREEPWLRQRVIDRLSVALLTGENDFNRGEVERWRQPMLAEVGVRARAWTYPKLGHAVPGGKSLVEVFRWLEEGLPARRALAKKHPASRMTETVSREDWAAALLAEGKGRLKETKSVYSGLMQLKGLHDRWPDVPAAREARTILEEYEGRTERPWEADDIAEQRRFLIAQARSLDGYASGPMPKQYQAQQGEMLRAAIDLWKQVIADGQDRKAVDQGRERIPKLETLLAKGGKKD
jgi:pimeloyl-ACP methyl ester carboxylesterase